MVTVELLKRDKCVWCARFREGVQVSFSDGSLSGFVCWPDFRKLLKSRSREDLNTAEAEVEAKRVPD